jgi:polyhydroxybutyrate depolymerase
MKRILRIVLGLVLTLFVLAILGVGAGAYLLYTPEPVPPSLSGTIAKGSIEAGGLTRTYQAYIPRDLPKGAPLVLVLHGSGESSRDIRIETGYAFERLADKKRFAVVYPDGFEGTWNNCNASGDGEATRRDVDDVGFLAVLADKLAADAGIDAGEVFATGVSDGGEMVIRLALEAPQRYRAVAPVAANLAAPDNFKCKPSAEGATSMLMVHGTADGLEPYEGGEGSVFGFFRSGHLLSTRETGQYFASRAGSIGSPSVARGKTADGFTVERLTWPAGSAAEVELFAIEGAGHVFPQPYYRARRLLGASPTDPDGAELIWAFFVRQKLK